MEKEVYSDEEDINEYVASAIFKMSFSEAYHLIFTFTFAECEDTLNAMNLYIGNPEIMTGEEFAKLEHLLIAKVNELTNQINEFKQRKAFG